MAGCNMQTDQTAQNAHQTSPLQCHSSSSSTEVQRSTKITRKTFYHQIKKQQNKTKKKLTKLELPPSLSEQIQRLSRQQASRCM